MDTFNKRRLFFFIFAVSGFSGLIYESIWSHYLKLFLGHAAYAQTLVLAIFMGGMALGAWLCSRYAQGWKNLLLVYAAAEALVGIAALLFHPLFTGLTSLSYTSILPALGEPTTVLIFKWLLATFLILPQSILLGMTFPLMSSGILRWYPQNPGHSVSILYFSNSIGAAIGVLVSGFVLIAWVGLPGTLLTAGLINLGLAALVWRLARNHDHPQAFSLHTEKNNESETPIKTKKRWFRLLLLVAALTGSASFIYEISWIRMLSLVLGSSTHAFELMLSAFIFGLAFGGLWIRNRIGNIKHPILALALVQLCMGALALSTLPLYDYSFDAMRWLVENLAKDTQGYTLFNLSSHAIALSIMLPTTFCAGMTLPLITYTLLKGGYGEKSIGAVYAANTVGAIAGVLIAVHIGLPLLGLKNLLWLGAALDLLVALGLLILFKSSQQTDYSKKILAGAAGFSIAVLLASALFSHIDFYKAASGVYRTGKLISADDTTILFHRDGKAATVDLHREKNGFVNIRTNGKVDANINMNQAGDISPDEPTMVLAAAVPIMLNPEAKSAAVIGMGSGLSTHTLLAYPPMQTVDTIEIEPAMVEAAKGFRPRVELTYSDPRSNIHIDDAKTYFSTHNKRYDIILSEPSNPWVSGTASLFTREFYRLIPNYLSEQGLLVQWIQLYELNMELVASIAKAVDPHFEDYIIYTATDHDILLVAKPRGRIKAAMDKPFAHLSFKSELKKIHIKNLQDLELRRLGSKDVLQNLFDSFDIRANSDYQPVLDLGAAKSRFLESDAGALVAMSYANPPVLKMLDRRFRYPEHTQVSRFHTPTKNMFTLISLSIRDFYRQNDTGSVFLPNKFRNTMEQMNRLFIQCQGADTDTWLTHLLEFSKGITPFLSPTEASQIWSMFESAPCFSQLKPQQQDWINLLHTVSLKQYGKMAKLAQWLLQHNMGTRKQHFEFLVHIAMVGELLNGKPRTAHSVWEKYATQHQLEQDLSLNSRLLLALSQNVS